MPEPSPPRCRTTNWSSRTAALRNRGALAVWSDPDMVRQASKSGKRGRPETFSDAAIQTCLRLEMLSGLPLRQAAGRAGSLIRMAGRDWPVPDFPAVCRRQARIAVQIPYRGSGQPLNLLIAFRDIVAQCPAELRMAPMTRGVALAQSSAEALRR
ncbi:transposase [Leisingera methylohalidivorans DSM 14336]|uniref:Transposase n=1 Tax=Leisingera methylohalidivorans DSM 14336 TaxID=999552 RepID=V9VX50_9RHOB|nr:transposase [Leisingera methylohalidivorans DSM 14336]